MQQLSFQGANDLRWEDVAAPRLTSDVACLVRPLAVATCDLDGFIVAGMSPFEAPFALGHEGVGEILEVGDHVTKFQPGERVSIPFQISCGVCAACSRGRTSNCRTVPRASTYGFGPHVGTWGGFLSDQVVVPYADEMLVAVPKNVSSAAAASVSDNIVDGWRAVAPGLKEEPGSDVLVVGGFGPGSIGLYATAAAVALGARRVLYADRDPNRRAIARKLGAEIHEGEWPRRLGSFPITVDACGTAEGLGLALRSTAPDGLCTSTAIYFDERQPVPLLEMYEKVCTFRTGRAHARPNMPSVLALLASGTLSTEPVTTNVVEWNDAVDALLEPGWHKLVISRESPVLAPSS